MNSDKIKDELMEDFIKLCTTLVYIGIKIEMQIEDKLYFSIPECYSSDMLQEIVNEPTESMCFSENNVLQISKKIISDIIALSIKLEGHEEGISEDTLSIILKNNQIQCYGKYRIGETWTQKEANAAYEKFLNEIKKEFHKSEYIKV